MSEFEELQKHAAARFEKFVAPIYVIDYRQIPKHIGSGFFLEVGPYHYFVTAAHTLVAEKGSVDERSTPIIFIGKNRIMRLTNFAYSHPNPGGVDDADIAVQRIFPDEIFGLPPYVEVEKESIKMNDVRVGFLPRQDKLYSVVGYPSSKNKVWAEGGIAKGNSMSYVDESPAAARYDLLSVNSRANILVNYAGKFDVNGKNLPPLAGVSGGAIFNLAPMPATSPESVAYSLIGVVTKHLPNEKLIKGTDIGAVLYLISKYDQASQ